MPVDPMRILSQRLRRRLTQTEAAGLARITQNRWSEYENGKMPVASVDIAERIAKALDVHLVALLTPTIDDKARTE